jgi:hypothetical protein
MIDISSEEMIVLGEVPNHLRIKRRGGKKLSIGTVFRWSTAGIKGVVLETLQVGGVRVTSSQSLQRFFDALSRSNADRVDTVCSVSQSHSVATRVSDFEAADRELDRQRV